MVNLFKMAQYLVVPRHAMLPTRALPSLRNHLAPQDLDVTSRPIITSLPRPIDPALLNTNLLRRTPSPLPTWIHSFSRLNKDVSVDEKPGYVHNVRSSWGSKIEQAISSAMKVKRDTTVDGNVPPASRLWNSTWLFFHSGKQFGRPQDADRHIREQAPCGRWLAY